MNVWEKRARERKTFRLVETVDSLALQLFNIDAHEQPMLVAMMLENFDAWEDLAKHAEVNPPSAETCRQVISVFKNRAHQGAVDSFNLF